MRILKIPNILGLPIWLIIILVLPTDILNAQPIYEPGEPHYKFEGKYCSDQLYYLQNNLTEFSTKVKVAFPSMFNIEKRKGEAEFHRLIVIEKVKKNKYKVTETIVNNNVLEENTYKGKLKGKISRNYDKRLIKYDGDKELSFHTTAGYLMIYSFERDIKWQHLKKVTDDEFDNLLNQFVELVNYNSAFSDIKKGLQRSKDAIRLIGMANPKFLTIKPSDCGNISFWKLIKYRPPLAPVNWIPGSKYYRFKGLVFGTPTTIEFEYPYHTPLGHSGGRNIIFSNIPSKQTNQTYSYIDEWVPPEVLEKDFKDLDYWEPVYHLNKRNCVLFAVKTPKGHSDGYNVNYFELIDFNSGSLKHRFYPENIGAYMEKIWGKDLDYYLSEFLPDGYIIYDHFIPEKKYSNIVLYDYYNNKIIDESEPVIHTEPKYFYDLSTDNKIWVVFMENTTTISFLSIDQKIEKKYTLNKNGENSFIFNEEIGLRLISYVGDQELKRGLHGIYEPVSSVVFNPIIHDDLLLVADKYKNLIILNLSKGGTQEKKYSVIQIKNNMLTDDDKKYLGQFLPIQDLNKFYIDL